MGYQQFSTTSDHPRDNLQTMKHPSEVSPWTTLLRSRCIRRKPYGRSMGEVLVPQDNMMITDTYD